jgi:hypothetical protein
VTKGGFKNVTSYNRHYRHINQNKNKNKKISRFELNLNSFCFFNFLEGGSCCDGIFKGVQTFMTNSNEGGGAKIVKKSVTSFMDGPLFNV